VSFPKSIPNHLALFLFAPIFLQCCAPLPVQSPAPPLSPQEIEHRISGFKDQQDRVTAFFSSGRLNVKTKDSESEANTLIIGTRNPFRIKIEITHRWGRQLLHILVNERGLHILSFPERRYYYGPIESLGSWKYFPRGLDRNQLWTFVRGYPVLPQFDRAVSLKGNQITLLNERDKPLQVIDFHPQSHRPRSTAFSGKEAKLHFVRFEKDGPIQYARTVRLDDFKTETTLSLNSKQMIFNNAIPEEIFKLEVPFDYERRPLTTSP